MKKERKKAAQTGKHILCQALKKIKAGAIFGYTGGAIMPLYDELEKFPELKHVMTRHEQGAAFAAQGYARATGELAFVFTTSGPGATNTITGVADAMMDSVPIMVITGQVATSVVGTDAFQESDVVGLMLPITKHSTVVTDTDDLAETFFKLTSIALEGRPGPVHLDLPKDIQLGFSSNTDYQLKPYDFYYPAASVPKKKYQQAAEIINQAKKPVVFCGHGVVISKSHQEFLRFIEKGKLTFASTSHGLSAVPSDHPLHLGMMGMHGTVAANKAIEEADCIVALGMRFDDRVTGKLSEYAPAAKIIHIDIDQSEIDKNVSTDLAINSDLKPALQAITPMIKKVARKDWLSKIQKNKAKWEKYIQPLIKKGIGDNGGLLMKTIVTKLSTLTKGKDNIVSDVGIHEMMLARFYNFQRFNTWFHSGGAGTMGFSLPTAIGVKVARPKERVWAVMGDGGFQMNVQELGTILAEQLDIKIVILNNSTLGMVRQWQTLFFNKAYAQTDMINPDFIKLADSYNIPGKRVSQTKEIGPAIKWAMKTKGPVILEFVCDKDEKIFPMVPSGANFREMIETHHDAN
ncbi:MAG: biosynthetic-type acetolactate synthase large subunit [Candidatus Woesebacteria bacterium]|jgi:acetolactate synthase-1/2/3 large subunit